MMRTEAAPTHEVRVDDVRTTQSGKALEKRLMRQRTALLYALLFVVSFIFTTGFMVLTVLLWVAPDNMLGLVLAGLLSGAVFVASFATLRMLVFYHVLGDHKHEDEEHSMGHHVAKSVTYGFLALVAAVVVAGLLMNMADAFTA
jgi:hypothetical protein